MIIRNKQIQLFIYFRVESFILSTIEFIRSNFPDFAEDKSDGEIRSYINKMMEICKMYEITTELNIQKFIHYHIHFQFDIPLHKILASILSENGRAEGVRLENFYLCLLSDRYRLERIILESFFYV
ncbi:MAG: hypothetical protein NTU44_06360 [Bacteroidetes bacterium]|nr:hypothetical protein [Bacteroidota bacterium]